MWRRVLIKALEGATGTRLIVVGGAGSLYVDEAKTLQVMHTPDFPKEYFATAYNQGENLKELQNASGIQWTFVSPSAFFIPDGKRTGQYVKGKDHLLVNNAGQSAIAIVDEIEQPKHVNERFTVGGEME
jgi:putative NADH-flavin reductase